MIVPAHNMQEYFREILQAVKREKALCVTETAQAYVIYLLTDFSRSEKVYAGTDKGEKPTLAFLLARAGDSNPDEATRIYKYVGDSSLYLLGFFNEALEQELPSLSYYESLGARGYLSVATLVRDRAAKSAALFEELADRFVDLVKLLHLMRLHSEFSGDAKPSDQKLLAWIEQYRKTQDRDILKMLKKYGVVLENEQKV